jgi:hypothetical protein
MELASCGHSSLAARVGGISVRGRDFCRDPGEHFLWPCGVHGHVVGFQPANDVMPFGGRLLVSSERSCTLEDIQPLRWLEGILPASTPAARSRPYWYGDACSVNSSA